MRLKVNGEALLKKLVEKNLGIKEGAELVKIPITTFSRAINKNLAVNTKTAAKLREAFGEEVIRIEG